MGALKQALLAFGVVGVLSAAIPASAQSKPDARIELNTATIEQLCTLPGIGPKRAALIVERRKKRVFTRSSQLLEVKGIGRKTLRKIRPFIRIVPPMSERKQAAARKHSLVAPSSNSGAG